MNIKDENTVLEAQITLWMDTVSNHKQRLKYCPIKDRPYVSTLVTKAESVLQALLSYKHGLRIT